MGPFVDDANSGMYLVSVFSCSTLLCFGVVLGFRFVWFGI